MSDEDAQRAEEEAARAAADTDAPDQPAERIFATHGGKNYADPTDAQLNAGQYIEFYSFSKNTAQLCFLDSYSKKQRQQHRQQRDLAGC